MGVKKLTKKSICKWDKKTIESNLDDLAALVVNPKYLCGNCGRAARRKQNLCKPLKFDKQD